MELHLQAIATVISLMNPMMCASIFLKCTSHQTVEQKYLSALQATAAIAITLIMSALFGARVLKTFGISLDAFSTAGGVVLIFMGFSMLNSKKEVSQERKEDSLGPLILFAASPGTITGVITLAVAQTGADIPISALVAVSVASFLTLISILASIRFLKQNQKDSLFRQTTTNLMGLIVLAMGFQFALSGIKSFFAH